MYILTRITKFFIFNRFSTYRIMNKVFFRNTDGSNDLHINFTYKNDVYNIDRTFNFCRSLDENVDDALIRIKNNLSKEMKKKFKKKLKKSKTHNTEVSNPDNLESQEVAVKFLREDKTVSNITFREVINNYSDGLCLKIVEENFEVLLNQPWIVNLALPASILSGFTTYPSKIEVQFADVQYCRAEWFTNKNSENLEKMTWIKCGEGFFYDVATDDIGKFLKLLVTPGNANNTFGESVEVISKNEIKAGPVGCPFENRHLFTRNQLKDEMIRIVSYNILADLYADSDFSRTQLFPYCQPYALCYEYRKQLLIKEILGYNADIICLQEVDAKAFNFDLKIVLERKQNNFVGLFNEKGSSGEGLATFFRKDRFNLVHTKSFNLGKSSCNLTQFTDLWEKINANEKLAKRLRERSTTLQVTLFKEKNFEKHLLIANIHLYFHPDADHIRLLQIGLAIMFIEETINNFELSNISIIFCGDFNSTPDCGIYKLMTEKFVGNDHKDWTSCREEEMEGVTLSQPFNFKSAYGTPQYTNFTHTFSACLDYIFYQCDNLEVQQIIPLPTKKELSRHVAIPSVMFPSDHLVLVADIKFK